MCQALLQVLGMQWGQEREYCCCQGAYIVTEPMSEYKNTSTRKLRSVINAEKEINRAGRDIGCETLTLELLAGCLSLLGLL